MNAATVAGIRRRFLILVGARWLGPGFLAPLLVLVLRDRGFSLAEVGMLFAVYGVTTAALAMAPGAVSSAM